ncbi:MAG: hypothetical protein HY825_17795 [Acidobacteria bacterium]|nr:hypothetical protein [Acidobacteriota bacterium]
MAGTSSWYSVTNDGRRNPWPHGVVIVEEADHALFVSPAPTAAEHRELFQASLLLTPATAKQILFVLP